MKLFKVVLSTLVIFSILFFELPKIWTYFLRFLHDQHAIIENVSYNYEQNASPVTASTIVYDLQTEPNSFIWLAVHIISASSVTWHIFKNNMFDTQVERTAIFNISIFVFCFTVLVNITKLAKFHPSIAIIINGLLLFVIIKDWLLKSKTYNWSIVAFCIPVFLTLFAELYVKFSRQLY